MHNLNTTNTCEQTKLANNTNPIKPSDLVQDIKHPKSAFMYFKQEQLKNMHAMWKVMPDINKTKYIELEKQDKLRFENELTVITNPSSQSEQVVPSNPSGQSEQVVPSNPSGQSGKVGNIRRRKTAFAFFILDQLAQMRVTHPNTSTRENMHLLVKKWKAMTDTDKTKYIELEKQDKLRFITEWSAIINSVNKDCSLC